MKEKKLFSFDELHLPIIFKDIILNFWVVILAVVTACMGIFTYDKIIYEPQYISESTFVVSPRSNGSYVGFYASLNTTNEMAGVFSEVFTSDVLKRKIREDLNEPDLSFTINAKVATGTNILCVSAIADSPKDAQSVMLSLMDNYGEVSEYLFGGVVLDTLKAPQVITTPYNPPNIVKTMILGMGASAFATIAIIVVLSIMRKTIKTRDSAKIHMEDSPLGILLKVKKSKLKYRLKNHKKSPLLITNMATGFSYVESMMQTSHKIFHKMRKNNQNVLLVTSCAENEGKSTIASNLALYMEKHGKRVALVDFDLRHPSIQTIFSEQSNLCPMYDIYDCLENGIPDTVGKGDSLLEIIYCSKPFRHPDRFLTGEKIDSFISELRNKVDYIILDSSPYTVAADTSMILQHADSVVMVVRQDWVPYKILQDIAEELDSEKAEYLGYILNNYRHRNTPHIFRQKF
ncbi:MAG: P-loop NTPase [Clostridia bacterium]|nr:P-loop NTPase [Clostridia bacterium]